MAFRTQDTVHIFAVIALALCLGKEKSKIWTFLISILLRTVRLRGSRGVYSQLCNRVHSPGRGYSMVKEDDDIVPTIVDECYDLEKTIGNLSDYFDYERFGRELFMFDYNMGEHGNGFRHILPRSSSLLPTISVAPKSD